MPPAVNMAQRDAALLELLDALELLEEQRRKMELCMRGVLWETRGIVGYGGVVGDCGGWGDCGIYGDMGGFWGMGGLWGIVG